ncbi:Uma2 family endonuclease [Roseofilum sp. Guam]|uniref:Uma2 family endonuclease n=1 Tax=Roseofilum sp. Guam TaxID=2821502 RepID=UPI00298E60E1|nr:Uma2 family endonuclease [Roseofilum sp. Guam]
MAIDLLPYLLPITYYRAKRYNPMNPTLTTSPEQSPALDWEDIGEPDVSDIVTEDDTPVDNLISEKQQRLLTTCLYSGLEMDQSFIAMANVGLFYGKDYPPLVPDALLSFGVELPEDMSQKKNRSYFVWNLGKPPDVAIEIVSNKVGNELGSKLEDYARARVPYYAVFDPFHCLSEKTLQVYELRGLSYHLLPHSWMDGIQLGLTLWNGVFEDFEYQWLRWCDAQGNLILTGDEKAQEEHQRAERLAQLLREHGIMEE